MKKLFFLVFVMVLLLLPVGFALKGVVPGEEVVKETNYGKLKTAGYHVNVDFLDDIKSKKNVNDLVNAIRVGARKVSINTSQNPEFKNKKAKITFSNVDYKNPILLHNGKWATNAVLFKSDSTTYFTIVPSFSEWEIIENTFTGNRTNLTVYGSGLGLDANAVLILDFENGSITDYEINDPSYYDNNGELDRYHNWFNLDNRSAWHEDGIVGGSIRLDGTEDYLITPIVDIDTEVTYSFWLLPELKDYGDPLSSYSAVNRLSFVTYANGDIRFTVGDGSWGNSTAGGIGTLTTGKWTHIVGTWNGTHTVIYADGVELANASNANGDLGIQYGIGRRQGGTYFWNGSIDELKIYDVALNSTQIFNIYTSENSSELYGSINFTDLLHQYTFDEDSGDLIDLVGSQNGTNYLVTYESDGKKDLAYNYTVQNAYTDLNSGIVDGRTAVTFSMWAKTYTMSSDGAPTARKLIGVNGGNSHHIIFNEVTKTTQIYFRNTSSDATACTTAANVGIDETGVWNHFVATIDTNGDGKARLYKNGVLICTGTTGIGGGMLAAGNLAVSASAGRYINGTVDELMIYNRSITQEEINNLLLYGQKKLELNFDELSGEVAEDASDNSNDATLTNYIRPGFNATGGTQSSGAMVFDGLNDYISIPDADSLDFGTSTNFSIAYWIKFNTNLGAPSYNRMFAKQNAFLSDVYGNEPRFFFNLAGGGDYTAISNTTITTTNWNHIVWNMDRVNGMSLYINNVSQPLDKSNNPAQNITSSTNLQIGKVSTQTVGILNGTIDDLVILGRLMTEEEIATLYLISPAAEFVYEKQGYYLSKVYNSTDIDPAIFTNQWLVLMPDTYYPSTFPFSARAGDCENVTSAIWEGGVWDGENYTFANTQGECMQFELVHEGDGTVSNIINNITIKSFKVKIPSASVVSIDGVTNLTQDSINGVATFFLNDTDEGVLNFEWFVNGVNVFNESVNSLLNNTNATSTLSDTFTSKNAQIYFIVTPVTATAYGNATGVGQQSSNLTVLNGNYNYTYDPTNSSVEVTKPRLRRFLFTISNDFDNDVVVSWYEDGVLQGTGQTYNFNPGGYTDYALVTLTANSSDGEYNYSMAWDITILPLDIQMVGSLPITLFILLIAGVVFALPFMMRKFSDNWFVDLIIRRCCWVISIFMMVFNSSIIATIASYSGIELTSEIFRYMNILAWTGYVAMLYLVAATIFDIVKMYTLNEKKKRMGDEYE